MKKAYIFLIVFGIILSISLVAGYVASQTELGTYIINLRLEASSGYPPRLTQIANEGVVQETALLSIIPKINFRGLSITEPYASMGGLISIDCGGVSQETKEFTLSTSNPGDKMIQKFAFKDLPESSVCLVTAQPLECTSQQTPSTCLKTKITYVFRTP